MLPSPHSPPALSTTPPRVPSKATNNFFFHYLLLPRTMKHAQSFIGVICVLVALAATVDVHVIRQSWDVLRGQGLATCPPGRPEGSASPSYLLARLQSAEKELKVLESALEAQRRVVKRLSEAYITAAGADNYSFVSGNARWAASSESRPRGRNEAVRNGRATKKARKSWGEYAPPVGTAERGGSGTGPDSNATLMALLGRLADGKGGADRTRDRRVGRGSRDSDDDDAFAEFGGIEGLAALLATQEDNGGSWRGGFGVEMGSALSTAASTGADIPANEFARRARSRMGDVRKKDSPTNVDGIIEQMAVQEKQRQAVQANDRPGKVDIEYVGSEQLPVGKQKVWEVPCADALYSNNWYGHIEGCTAVKCSRHVRDHVASPQECSMAVRAIRGAMVDLFHQGGSTSLVPDSSSKKRLGEQGYALIQMLRERVRDVIAEDYELDELYDSGALLTRLTAEYDPHDMWEMAPQGHDYWNPHVDKANIASYDYSALLYLNTQSDDPADIGTTADFTGGKFSFIDGDVNRVVPPVRGRLVTFTSGLENLHRVREVTKGTRFVLAMWFTCSAKHEYEEKPLAP